MMNATVSGLAALLGQVGISRSAANAGSEIAEQASDSGMQVLVVVGGLALLVIVLAMAIKMRRD